MNRSLGGWGPAVFVAIVASALGAIVSATVSFAHTGINDYIAR